MSLIQGRGSFIGGEFEKAGGQELQSLNPAKNYEPVFTTSTGDEQVDAAVRAARGALKAWMALTQEERNNYLLKLKEQFIAHKDEMAERMVLEMGKPLNEARGEAASLGARIDLMIAHGIKRVSAESPPGVVGEARYRAQGVLAVLGPYNFPAHLVNAHVIPALLTGNTLVVKPSEVTPGVGELYATCVEKAGLPVGVYNMVQGTGTVGQKLTTHSGVDGVLFTGSYRTGRAIAETMLDHPGKMLALEMGGKNMSVVMGDADLYQALVEIVQGAFLSAGQRCTATSRVLVQKQVAPQLIEALTVATRNIKPGDPMKADTFMGPLASKAALDAFLQRRALAESAGIKTLVAGEVLGGGAFVTPSLHLNENKVAGAGYLDEELFGPDICVQVIEDLDEAIAIVNESPYGLSNSIFTSNRDNFERMYIETRSGLLNYNRSTNGASGMLPFGGVGKSGNQRAAGIDAVRYSTFPVAIQEKDCGDVQTPHLLANPLVGLDEQLRQDAHLLLARHDVERLLERYGLAFDDAMGSRIYIQEASYAHLNYSGDILTAEHWTSAGIAHASHDGIYIQLPIKGEVVEFINELENFLCAVFSENADQLLLRRPTDINVPAQGQMPRSAALLRRLYRDGFVPVEKKSVVDMRRTRGVFLRSTDADPMIINDAASQIASLGTGFNADSYLRALDDGTLDTAILANGDITVPFIEEEKEGPLAHQRDAAKAYADFLLERVHDDIKYVAWANGGAEANEKAFDLCRMNGPGGKRILAFEGSFHGRTMMSLQATWNKTKRAPFQFDGYTCDFVAYPHFKTPDEEPEVPMAWIQSWSEGRIPQSKGDSLLNREIESLTKLKGQLEGGDICCVIIEPMQSEGGDNYGTARFYNGLRALTRHFNAPLIFDEVQVGFRLGGPFFWHDIFNLKNAQGKADAPDCVTLAKKAQLGVVLSRWEDTRPGAPHVLQTQRGLIHGQDLEAFDVQKLVDITKETLLGLQSRFPEHVLKPRVCGFAFAFDLPSPNLAQQLIAQRFYRGFMVYIAGTQTVRYRLNTLTTQEDLDRLFSGIEDALNYILNSVGQLDGPAAQKHLENFKAPSWIDPAAVDTTVPMGLMDIFTGMSDAPQARLEWALGLEMSQQHQLCDLILKSENQWPAKRLAAALKHLLGADTAAQYKPSQVRQKLAESLTAHEDTSSFNGWRASLGEDPTDVMAQALGGRITRLMPNHWASLKKDIMAIEEKAYEAGRQDSEADLKRFLDTDNSLCFKLERRTESGKMLLGYAFGGPIEAFSIAGPGTEKMNGKNNSFYTANITLHENARRCGGGSRLKLAQAKAAAAEKNMLGEPRYHFVTGRNRVGHTAEIGHINKKLAAYEVEVFDNQYGDEKAQALYYRIPLQHPALSRRDEPKISSKIEWASSVHAPLGLQSERLQKALEAGYFTDPVGTKLTLSNWTTPEIVRYAEVLRDVAPLGLNHVYFSSSRDELVDKGLRSLRIQRKDAQLIIGLERQYVGHTTAAARSLSDPAGFQAPFGFFDWPLVSHPAEVGAEETMMQIKNIIAKEGADNILALTLELVGERSGYVLSDEFLAAADALRAETGIPLVFVESAGALGRNGKSLFVTDSIDVTPNMVLWYTGVQLGQIFVDDHYYVPKPLTLISTWDGDEVCMRRTLCHLREAQSFLGKGVAAAFMTELHTIAKNVKLNGSGLWQVLDFGDETKAEKFLRNCYAQGLRLGRGLPGRVVIAPSLTMDETEMKQGLKIIAQAL